MFRFISRYSHIVAILALGLVVTLVTIDTADARRASSGFGSRGSRTFQAPATTRTAPSEAAPIDRTMTPRTQANQPSGAQAQANAPRPGLFGGFGRSMIGGLLLGGLVGAMFGGGFGGGLGFLGMLLQMALLAGVVMLAIRFFANRQRSAAPAGGPSQRSGFGGADNNTPAFRIPTIGGGADRSAQPAQTYAPATKDLAISQVDLDRFERLLVEIQTAYGAENYAELRKLTTPEAMSYLAEELGENATKGVRNQVSDVRLVQGDISEAWQEGTLDYATLAMKYESIDVMVDRTSGKVVEGDTREPSETTEVWTFVRKPANDWQLSAIQAA